MKFFVSQIEGSGFLYPSVPLTKTFKLKIFPHFLDIDQVGWKIYSEFDGKLEPAIYFKIQLNLPNSNIILQEKYWGHSVRYKVPLRSAYNLLS